MSWYNGAWPFRKKLTINVAQVAGALTNYPALVSIGNDTDLLDAQYDGDDFLFTSSDGTTKLSHEIVTFDPLAVANVCWTWFSNPRALRYVGTNDCTYVGWVDASGNTKIGQYNHTTKAWATLTLSAALEADDHNNTAVYVRPDGKIIGFYSKHNTDTLNRYRISSSAEDVSAFAVEQTLNEGAGNSISYSNPRYLSGETTLYLFYRVLNATNVTWRYRTSADDGATWSASTTLWKGDNATNRTPYLHVAVNGTGRLDFVATNCHPNEAASSLYHFYYQGAKWYQSDGTEIVGGIPAGGLAPADVTQVYDGTTTRGWNWDIAIDSTSRPVIAYATFPGAPGTTTDHRYNVARWTGAAWSSAQVVAGGKYVYVTGSTAEVYYSGGMALDHDNVDHCYVSRETATDSWQIERYDWSGAAWALGATISARVGKQARPVVPWNSASTLKVLWWNGYYDHFASGKYLTDLWTSPHTKSATDKLVAYVKVPSLSALVDTDLYLYYGNAAATNQEDATNVWDANYLVVWHGRHAATSTRSVKESTVNNKPLTKVTAVSTNDLAEVPGKIAMAQIAKHTAASTGPGDYMSGAFGSLAGLATWHAEAWFYYAVQSAVDVQSIMDCTATTTVSGMICRVGPAGASTAQGFCVRQADTQIGGAFADITLSAGAWAWMEWMFDQAGTGLVAAMNTTKSGAPYAAATVMDAGASTNMFVGRRAAATTGFCSRNSMFESLRISNIVRSDAWRTTQYANQNDPATFWTVGSEELYVADTNPFFHGFAPHRR